MPKELEVNGATLNIADEDQAELLSNLTIGSPVVVFVKNYSDWSICPGIVTGFAENGTDFSAIAVTIYKDDKVLTVPISNDTKEKYLLAKTASLGMLISRQSITEKLYKELHEAELKTETIKEKIAFFNNFTAIK